MPTAWSRPGDEKATLAMPCNTATISHAVRIQCNQSAIATTAFKPIGSSQGAMLLHTPTEQLKLSKDRAD